MNKTIDRPPHSRLTEPSKHLYEGKDYVPADKQDLKALFEHVYDQLRRQQIPSPWEQA